MTTAARHSRSVLMALLALAVSASLAFAGQPAGTAAGLTTAATHSGKSVPVKLGTDGSNPNEADSDAADPTDSGSPDNCATDPTNLSPEELAALTHGSIVCWAAHQATPDGYANHGAWVSHWAKLGTGGENAGNSATTHGKSAGHRP